MAGRMCCRSRSSIIATALYFLAHSLQLSGATSIPKPLSVPATAYWDGDDGPWSTFGMQVGSPAQSVRLLPATGSGTIWVVDPLGCSAQGDASNCKDKRGTLYFNDRSSTWKEYGTYGLFLVEEIALGYASDAGLYGWDAVTLGWPGENLPSVRSQILASIATKAFYMGALPLNPWPVNFTELVQSSPSFISNLKNQSDISSLTWGYTAGMFNHVPPLLGSLTFGGYDASRCEWNDLNFTMASDISRDLVVAIQSVTSNLSSTPLLSNPIFTFIDSLVPYIWLPIDACRAFERAFNLTWDIDAELYLVDDNLHRRLLAQNPSVTFQIGPLVSGPSVNIEMPYGSFDLQASAPLVANSSRYFPLKRAANETQYILGRAFLQNAYVAANYEYFNFSVAQAKYPSSAVQQKLIALPSKSDKSPGKKRRSRTGAKVGLAIGVIIALVLALFLLWWVLMKKPKSTSSPFYEATSQRDEYSKAELDSSGQAIFEAGNTPFGHELDSLDKAHAELHGSYKSPVELDNDYPSELAANEVAASEIHGLESATRARRFSDAAVGLVSHR